MGEADHGRGDREAVKESGPGTANKAPIARESGRWGTLHLLGLITNGGADR
jgi:hypothetical protein